LGASTGIFFFPGFPIIAATVPATTRLSLQSTNKTKLLAKTLFCRCPKKVDPVSELEADQDTNQQGNANPLRPQSSYTPEQDLAAPVGSLFLGR
jgi:hypothetical protein